jgi:hypothetical protein
MRRTRAVFVTLCLALSLEARVHADYLYTTLTAPSSFATWAYGINDKGGIVGSYNTTAGGTLNGYILSNGGYTTIDSGSFVSTTVTGINNAGSIIGFLAVPFLGNQGSFQVAARPPPSSSPEERRRPGPPGSTPSVRSAVLIRTAREISTASC